MFLAAIAFVLAAEPPKLPPPHETPSVTKHPKVVGWPEGKMPTAPDGFTVNLYADGLDNPRWMYFLPNGDLLVSEAQSKKKDMMPANRITLFRGLKDGKPESRHVFADGLHQPFGMCLVGDTLFVGCTDALLAFPYKKGQTKLDGKPLQIMALPAGGYNNHWTRNVIANAGGTKLYVTVGSASNVAEHGMKEEMLRANVLEMDLDGTALRVFASGLRNPVGLDWEPKTGALWAAVNERDELGDELVPDYITSVKEGGFYGWPFSYYGAHEDPRRKGERPDLVAKALVPDLALGSHTASLGLTFYRSEAFPTKYLGGAFVGQHGSWNRSKFVGYRVAFVPFKEGKPAGAVEDFLTGFIKNDEEVYGRPVGVAVAPDGALLVTDDAGNRIWRVAPKK